MTMFSPLLRATLITATYAGRELAKREEARPLDWIRWLPPQDIFLRDSSKLKLYRAGNQSLGKTTAGLTQVIWHCLGSHPHYRVPPPPVEWWIVCESHEQSVAIQKKLWDLLPKSEVDPETEFDEVRGFRGRLAACKFKNGSIIRIKTNNQGAMKMAGATIHGVMFDEPPLSSRMFEEIRKRVKKKAGWLILTMTPVNRDCTWIKEMAESGAIVDHHFPLRAEYLIPVGSDMPLRDIEGTVCDEEWIEQLRAETVAHEQPVTVDGEWEMRVTGRVFTEFRSSGPDSHVHTNIPKMECRLLFGIDHGSKATGAIGSKEICFLVLVDESGHDHDLPSRVYVLDEFSPPGSSTPEMDAKGVLDMLKRNGLEWSDIDEAKGDRVHMPGSVSQKSNKDLMKSIAKLKRVHRGKLSPKIRTVSKRKWRGSGPVETGNKYLHRQMIRPGGFGVHPRCKRLVESLDKYDLRDNEFKDPIDALRYALESYVYGTRGPGIRYERHRNIRRR